MIKRKQGFTLIEVMMAVGVSSILILTAQQIMSKISRTNREAQQRTQMNEILFGVIGLLEKSASCRSSLVGRNASAELPANGDQVPSINNSRGLPLYPIGVYGQGASRVEIGDIRISSFENSNPPFFNGRGQATVSLTLKRGSLAGQDLAALTQEEQVRLRAREGGGRLQEIHYIPVNVMVDDATGLVTNCTYSLFSGANDVRRVCEMLGGTIAAGDNCTGLSIEALDASARGGGDNIGATLYADGDVRMGVPTATSFFRTGGLQMDSSNSPSVNGNFNLVVNNLVTPSLGMGGQDAPATTGYLDTAGDIHVGPVSTAQLSPRGGVAVANDLYIRNPNRLTVNALPTTIVDTTENDRIVVTADWAAHKIADTMASDSTDINSIKDQILAGGTAVAQQAILRYMCSNVRLRSFDFSGPLQGRTISTFNEVAGEWVSGQCRITPVFKKNCSDNENICETIETREVCISGTCMTRWPYAMKESGCAWKNTCLSRERQFGRADHVPAGPGNRLCCNVGMSDFDVPPP